MAFTKYALVALVASAISNVDGFSTVVSGRQQPTLNNNAFTRRTTRITPPTPLCVTLSSVDDIVSEDEPEPEPDFIVSADDLDAPTEEYSPSDKFVHASNIAEARAKYARSENDTGSPEYQVAGMTERITYLTSHLKTHPKDFSTRRGLVALVNKRRRLLNYLFEEDVNRYKDLVSSLGIRHKAPGRVQSRAEQYAQYPGQKKKKTHSKN